MNDEPETTPKDSALALRREAPEWLSFWLASQARPWRTLALVPGDRGLSTVELAGLLMMVGRDQGETIGVADLRDVQSSRVGAMLEVVQSHVEEGERMVLATSSIADNLATIPIARAADAVLLCATLGRSSMASIQATVRRIGRERFLGGVLVRESSARRPR
jgi:hypothetical protein